ncbi:MAG: UPF0175 family protein [Acidobacteriota bacterium]
MSMQLEIPDEVAQAIRLPPGEQRQRLTVELALSLYAQGILSFGKAQVLSGLKRYEFGRLLGQRMIPRHYDREDVEDDVAYARGQ